MKHKLVLSRKRYVTSGLFALVLALGLLLLMPLVGQANTVNISDAAHVLNVSQVRTEAANLSDPINIYTTNTFNGSKSAFDQQTRSHITSSNLLVIAIDTVQRHLTIVGGSSVPLSNSQYTDATQAFVSAYSSNNNSYTAATIASIHSLRDALGSSSNGGVTGSSSTNGGIFSGLFGTLCCVGLLILVIAGAFFVIGRRMFGRGRRAMPMGGNAMPYQQPYNQGYPPNYGGPYNQGQGMNPLAAGGLGAAAGGLLGYELGKERGEDQMREQDQNQGGNWNGGGNDFGGGSSADFGGNNGGNFGGGSSADFGSGGDGGNFGGGGDFGGGGGGGDFGGGGGGGGGGDF
ncbi:MAG: hypothetical protein ACR2H5_17250 [Ktedonobacteraceae bacterium]